MGLTMKKGIRKIVLYAALSALMVIAQVVLAPLPNVEAVSLLLIVYTVSLGVEALYPLYTFVLVQGLLYGFGLWFLNYTYVWAVLFLVTMLFRNRRSPWLWALVSAAFGLCFGALCALPYLFMGGPASAFAYWVSGIPFDITHGVGNGVLAVLLFKPLHRVMERLHNNG